jgi:putative acetyltransferase
MRVGSIGREPCLRYTAVVMQGFNIRRAREEDAGAVYEAHSRSIREVCSSHYNEEETRAWAGRLYPGVHVLSILSHDFFVAEDAQGIIGFSELIVDSGEVRAVYVHPRALRKGVGSALLSAVENVARLAGLTSLHLFGSLNAVPFYESAGYRIEKSSAIAITPDVTIACVIMKKKL